jgi:hypothetical protein
MEETPRPGSVKAGAPTPVLSPYHSPVLRLHGALARLTQSVGTTNGDGGQNMML